MTLISNKNKFQLIKQMSSVRILSRIFLLVSLLLSCSENYNPFDDNSNANAVISWSSFNNEDTLQIFHKETLDVFIAVKELVDSVTVTAMQNRLFNVDTTIIPQYIDSNGIKIFVSFFDTGQQRISITTWRKNGDEVNNEINVYVESPLYQKPINASYDDSVTLFMHGVFDDDVIYFWDFGRGEPIQSSNSKIKTIIDEVGVGNSGICWVSDLYGIYSSPKFEFEYSFCDTTGPVIKCVNDGFADKDTILTNETTFFLKLNITDRGKSNISNATVDDSTFDIIDNEIFVKIFHQMDTLSGYKKITVMATDNSQDNNKTIKTFYLSYDPTILNSSNKASLNIGVPSQDSIVSHSRKRYVFGNVENYKGELLNVKLKVNDSVYTTSELTDSFKIEWGWPIYLSENYNKVTISVLNSDENVVVDSTITMIFDSSAVDTSSPVILEITMDGKPVEGLFVSEKNIIVQVIAFDEESGLKLLKVQGRSSVVNQHSDGYVWPAPLFLEHKENGNLIKISAIDNMGIKKDTSVTVFLNSAPQVSIAPTPPLPLFVGQTYLDTINANDIDGDRLTYKKILAPDGLFLDSLTGRIYWTAESKDTGENHLVIDIDDQYETTQLDVPIYVIDSTDYGIPPKFITTEQDFNEFVEVGDSVKMNLKTSNGFKPITFSATVKVDGLSKNFNITDSTFFWTPGNNDLGYHSFSITAKDKFGRADTIYPRVLVVPTNRPCNLELDVDLDSLSNGAYDLSKSTQPETLTFIVIDPDTMAVESHKIFIDFGKFSNTMTLNNENSFFVVIDPKENYAEVETLTVSVSDIANHTDTLSVKLNF